MNIRVLQDAYNVQRTLVFRAPLPLLAQEDPRKTSNIINRTTGTGHRVRKGKRRTRKTKKYYTAQRTVSAFWSNASRHSARKPSP
eukprot:832210-Prorocentrum_minimum.AAC.2